MTRMNAASAIATYDQALQAHFASDVEIVLDGLVKQGLHYDGRAICNVLRPFLVDAEERARRDRIAELVAQGVRVAVAHAARAPAVRKQLLLTEAEEEAIRFEEGHTGMLFARLDGFVDAQGRLRFLEHNPFPSGFAYADKIAERFEATASFRHCASRFELGYQRLIPQFVRSLLSCVAHISADGRRAVGIVAPPTGAESVDAVPEIAFVLEELARAGVSFHMSDEGGLSLKNDRLAVDGRPVDAVFVTNWEPFLSTEAGRRSPLWVANRARTVALLDSPCSNALNGAKTIFALLSDPAYEGLFPSEVRDALRRHVPWTRPVAEGTTTYRGEPVNLVRTLRERREDLVLKPAHAFGGTGVVLGWESTESGWDAAIAEALATPYVVQERVFAHTDSYPMANAGKLEQRSLSFDWNPFVWNDGRVHGAISRLGEQSILNVKAGASLVPIFSVDNQGARPRRAPETFASGRP
jgi:hypothetical protein